MTPGQNAAMWWGERCLGRGVINEVNQERVGGKEYNGSAEVGVALEGLRIGRANGTTAEDVRVQ